MIKSIKISAIAAASAGMLAVAAPASAAPAFDTAPAASTYTGSGDSWQHSRDRRYYSSNRYGSRQAYYGEPVSRNTRVWRGRDGRVYCRRSNGTTGLIVGGAAGALLGREVDGGRNRTVGTVLGAAAGALLGREIQRGGGRCR